MSMLHPALHPNLKMSDVVTSQHAINMPLTNQASSSAGGIPPLQPHPDPKEAGSPGQQGRQLLDDAKSRRKQRKKEQRRERRQMESLIAGLGDLGLKVGTPSSANSVVRAAHQHPDRARKPQQVQKSRKARKPPKRQKPYKKAAISEPVSNDRISNRTRAAMALRGMFIKKEASPADRTCPLYPLCTNCSVRPLGTQSASMNPERDAATERHNQEDPQSSEAMPDFQGLIKANAIKQEPEPDFSTFAEQQYLMDTLAIKEIAHQRFLTVKEEPKFYNGGENVGFVDENAMEF